MSQYVYLYNIHFVVVYINIDEPIIFFTVYFRGYQYQYCLITYIFYSCLQLSNLIYKQSLFIHCQYHTPYRLKTWKRNTLEECVLLCLTNMNMFVLCHNITMRVYLKFKLFKSLNLNIKILSV